MTAGHDRIRVVEAVLNLEGGGLERVVADLVRRLDPDRFDVHVVALRYLGRQAEGLERHAALHTAPALPPWTLLWPRPLEQLLRRIKPDVVHSHSGAWYKSAVAAHLAGIHGMVHTEHGRPGPDTLSGRTFEYLASRRTDAMVAVSDDLSRSMKPWVSRRCLIEVILNGVDTDEFAPGRWAKEWRERLSLGDQTPVIGIVSRLDPIKDFPMLLQALAILRRDWQDGEPPVLVIAGDGPERARIGQLAAELGLQRAIHAIGWVGATVDLYPLFDVFTLSSRSEGTSIALLEAMSSGVCPVVTAVGGNPSVLGAELAELLVPSGAADRLAEGWKTVLLNREARRRNAATARRRVVEHFSLAAMVAKHETLYERLHATRRISGRASGVDPATR